MVDFGVNIELNAASAQAVILQLVNRLDDLEKQARETGEAGDRMGDKFRDSAQRPLNTLGGLEDQLKRLRGELEDVEVGSDAFRDLSREINRTAEAAASARASVASIGDEANNAGGKFAAFGEIAKGALMRLGELGIEAIGQGIQFIGAQAAESVNKFAAYQQSMLVIEQQIKTTGGAAGITAQEIRGLAESISENTTASISDVTNASQILLSYTNVTGDMFEETIRLSQDFMTVLKPITGDELPDAVERLGEALQSPIAGLEGLEEAKIYFTESEKEAIKAMEESGNLAEAQRIILDKVKESMEGVAEAAGQGLAGGLAEMNKAVENAQLLIGAALAPAITAAANFMADLVQELLGGTTGADKMASASEKLAAAIKAVDVGKVAADIRSIVAAAADAAQAISRLIGVLNKVNQLNQFMNPVAGMVGMGQRVLSGVASIAGYSEGGLVTGGSSPTADDVPAMLSGGEYVLKASAVKTMGTDFLDSLNSNNPDFSALGAGRIASSYTPSFGASGMSPSSSNGIASMAAISESAIQRGIKAASQFNGIAARCAATTEAFTKELGLNTSVMDLTADSAKKVGKVMTDFSKIQPGDIIGWSGTSKFGDEHVGTYLGDQQVAHQSGRRGYKFGVYDDFNYFKNQPGAYFVRPDGAPQPQAQPTVQPQAQPQATDKVSMIAAQLKQGLGINEAQIAGIIGNFMREAGHDLNPRINEGGKVGLPLQRGGYGLAQWTGSRQTDLINFAGGKEAAGDLKTQVAFTIKELLGTERNALNKLKQTQTPEEAAAVFEKYYERAGVVALAERQANARKAYGQITSGGAMVSDIGGMPVVDDGFAKIQEALQREFDNLAGDIDKFGDGAERARKQKEVTSFEMGLQGQGLSSQEIGRRVEFFKVDQEAIASLNEYETALMESGLSAEQATELYGKAKEQVTAMVIAQREQINLDAAQQLYEGQMQANEAIAQNINALNEQTATLEYQAQLVAQYGEIKDSEMQYYEAEKTALADIAALKNQLNEAEAAGLVTAEQATAILADRTSAYEEMKGAIAENIAAQEQLTQAQQVAAEEAARLAEVQQQNQQIIGNLTGAFTNFATGVISGADSMGEAIGKLAQNILGNLANQAFSSLFGSLFGGIFGGGGSGVKLFAKGGIIDKPTNAIMGEAGAEAVVPLPDGRSIPVVMQGGGGGGTTNITVNVQNSGGGAEDGRRLGRQISEAIKSELANQKRVGGLLR